MAVIYAELIKQYKFKYQAVFSTRFDKQDEDNQMLDAVELYININIHHNLTGRDNIITAIKSPLEYQILKQEIKVSG